MQELLRDHAGDTASMVLPAALLRRLALHREQDSVLRAVVKYLAGQDDDDGAARSLAGRHGIAGGAGTATAAADPATLDLLPVAPAAPVSPA